MTAEYSAREYHSRSVFERNQRSQLAQQFAAVTMRSRRWPRALQTRNARQIPPIVGILSQSISGSIRPPARAVVCESKWRNPSVITERDHWLLDVPGELFCTDVHVYSSRRLHRPECPSTHGARGKCTSPLESTMASLLTPRHLTGETDDENLRYLLYRLLPES